MKLRPEELGVRDKSQVSLWVKGSVQGPGHGAGDMEGGTPCQVPAPTRRAAGGPVTVPGTSQLPPHQRSVLFLEELHLGTRSFWTNENTTHHSRY